MAVYLLPKNCKFNNENIYLGIKDIEDGYEFNNKADIVFEYLTRDYVESKHVKFSTDMTNISFKPNRNSYTR